MITLKCLCNTLTPPAANSTLTDYSILNVGTESSLIKNRSRHSCVYKRHQGQTKSQNDKKSTLGRRQKQSEDHSYINLKRKRRLLDQQEAPLMQTRRRSEQSQYLEIREMLKINDKDMTIILEVYPDTKSLLQELKKGNLQKEIEKLLLK